MTRRDICEAHLKALVEFFGYVILILGYVKMALKFGYRAMRDLVEVALILERETTMGLRDIRYA
ncbi:MAG: hypothetical protein MZV49_07820 [Rhodopseudomonas palustris]|nr:hypothetical protein [Rhodopseudomonas palustris]